MTGTHNAPATVLSGLDASSAYFLPFGFFFAVLAAFLKSCALGASLLLGLRGFFPAARRLRMFS